MAVKLSLSEAMFWVSTLEDVRDGVEVYPREDLLPAFDDSESKMRVELKGDLKYALAQLAQVRKNSDEGSITVSSEAFDSVEDVMVRARTWISRPSFLGFDADSVARWRQDLLGDLERAIKLLKDKLPIPYRRFEDLDVHELASLIVASELHVKRLYEPEDPAARSWTPRDFYYLEWHEYDWPRDVGQSWAQRHADVIAFAHEHKVSEDEARETLYDLLEDYFDYAQDVFYENEDRIANEEGCAVHLPTLGVIAFARELNGDRYGMEMWHKLVRGEPEDDEIDEVVDIVFIPDDILRC